VVDGRVVFDLSRIPVADRQTLNKHAALLSEAFRDASR
jgi:hypothetical protein